MSGILETEALSNDDAKILEMANDQTNNIMDDPGNQAQYTLYNLGIPKYLRLIANSPHSTLSEKIDALELLNKFAANPDFLTRMLADDFYVTKSAELLQTITPKADLASLSPQEVDLFMQELAFMEKLTKDKRGVDFALESDKDTDLIDNLFRILKSDAEVPMRRKALDVLLNLLELGDSKKLEDRVIKELPDLLKNNKNTYELLCPLVRLGALYSAKSDVNKEKILETDFLGQLSGALALFPEG